MTPSNEKFVKYCDAKKACFAKGSLPNACPSPPWTLGGADPWPGVDVYRDRGYVEPYWPQPDYFCLTGRGCCGVPTE